MKHLILGTAGHVDHGKTALVKALTGIDCDTHKEEKRRGITINLGFAHLGLPSGDEIGIIDVPGHRDFVHTMVGGASGIDIALLVVAADSGIMPQTREHVRIMELLGIRSGIVALTRIDLATPEMGELAAEEVVAFTKGTFLQGCPVVPVSSVTGTGIRELTQAIAAAAERLPQRPAGEVFRMYIDRIFTVSGFGTVATGSVLGGRLATGANAFLMPAGRELRVRRLERYGHEVAEVCAGDRASVNLVGLSREEFMRGMMIADRPLRTTKLLDVRLHLFESSRQLPLWSQTIFLMGTFEAQARIHLLDRDSLAGGKSAIAQVHLPSPCAAQFGDRFVVRSTSSDITLGGGEVVDASPLHHRRRRESLVAELGALAGGNRGEMIAAAVRKQPAGISHTRLAEQLNLTPLEVLAALPELPGDISAFSPLPEKATLLITADAYGALERRCAAALEKHHRENPLIEEGKTPEELAGMLGLGSAPEAHILLRHLLETLGARGVFRQVHHTWALATHAVVVSKELERFVGMVDAFVKERGNQMASIADCQAALKEKGADERVLKQVLYHLVNKHAVYAIEGHFVHAAVVDTARAKLVENLQAEPAGLTVARFRDLIEGNRKLCLVLFVQFEDEGIVERRGDVRVLKERAKGER